MKRRKEMEKCKKEIKHNNRIARIYNNVCFMYVCVVFKA